MHDTPPGRPHRPAPDAGPDDALVGELRDLMEQAAAGLAPLPDLTQEAVRLGRRRRVRARAAVVGAVAGVLAAGGIGSAVLGGLGDTASPPVSPAAAPPTATVSSAVPSPVPSVTPPAPTAVSEAVRRARTAAALTRALGDLIGTVSPDGERLFAGRIDGHAFPVTFQVVQGKDTLGECPDPPEMDMTCRITWLPDGSEARVVESGPALWGGQSVSVTYRYVNAIVKLTIAPDTDDRVSPPVSADQLVAAAGTSALLAEVKYEVKYEAETAVNSSSEAPDAPPSTGPAATAEPSTAESFSAGDLSDTGSANETGGSPDE